MPSPSPLPSRSPSPAENIAAAMGFSTFGAKPNPPKKKRKLADPTSEGSGSNNTPLGVRTRKLAGQQAREDEGRCQDTSNGTRMGGVQDQGQWSAHSESRDGRTTSNALPAPDPLAAAALDETAGMLLETGLLPQYLDWSEGFVEWGPHDNGRWEEQRRVGGDEMRRQGKRSDGEWDWHALRKGVLDERGDVAFYDGSFVEDPWRGLGAGNGR